MENKNILKPIFTRAFGLAFLISVIVGSSFFALVYQVEIARKKNVLLYDTIQNNSQTHELVEGVILPLDDKILTSPFKKTPCLVYWYFKTERYTTTDSKGKSQTSTRIVDEANDRLPFEIRTRRNEFYKIYTEIEYLKHDYSESISPVEAERETHYELTLKEGDRISALIKKEIDPALVTNEILIYKDTKEVWLADLKDRIETKWHFIMVGIFFVVSLSILSFTYFFMRKSLIKNNV